MKVNFIANFANGYVGEVSDAVHLAREIESLGHTVQKVPQDIWKAICDGEWNPEWGVQAPKRDADINIICKWHHFNDEKYIDKLKVQINAPVFYWVWDYMEDGVMPEWHVKMVSASSLYLGNDVRNSFYYEHPNSYYFPFDVADRDIPRHQIFDKEHDVVFFGSWIEQGNRQKWLQEINKTHPITIFSWNAEAWPDEFKNVNIAVYGDDFAREVAKSKIVIGFSVEPNCWGYWSNRVGKILTLNGFLLYQYAPGMELFLKDGVAYFSSIEEATEKIGYYLKHDYERLDIAKRGFKIGQNNFTSHARIKELMILAERYVKTQGKGWVV